MKRILDAIYLWTGIAVTLLVFAVILASALATAIWDAIAIYRYH